MDTSSQPVESKPHRPGRRCLLTSDLQDKICTLIRKGAWDYVAAEANGVSRATFMDWMARGRGDGRRPSRTVFVNFAKAVEQAQAEGRAAAETQAKKIDPKWWLARKFPEWSGTTEEEKESRRVTVTVELADTAAERIARLEPLKAIPIYSNGDRETK